MARAAKTTTSVLSPRAVNLLGQLFSETSNLTVPAGVAGEVVEIRQWVSAQQAPVAALTATDE